MQGRVNLTTNNSNNFSKIFTQGEYDWQNDADITPDIITFRKQPHTECEMLVVSEIASTQHITSFLIIFSASSTVSKVTKP